MLDTYGVSAQTSPHWITTQRGKDHDEARKDEGLSRTHSQTDRIQSYPDGQPALGPVECRIVRPRSCRELPRRIARNWSLRARRMNHHPTDNPRREIAIKDYESHGHTAGRKRTKTYMCWRNMISRCTNPNRPDYKFYGARGVMVCERWRLSFASFLADMGECPAGKSIDRYPDNDGGYESGNCRWASKGEQMQNTRSTRLITFGGETMGLNAWAKKLGMNKESLRIRLNSWPLHEAMTRPKKGA